MAISGRPTSSFSQAGRLRMPPLPCDSGTCVLLIAVPAAIDGSDGPWAALLGLDRRGVDDHRSVRLVVDRGACDRTLLLVRSGRGDPVSVDSGCQREARPGDLSSRRMSDVGALVADGRLTGTRSGRDRPDRAHLSSGVLREPHDGDKLAVA